MEQKLEPSDDSVEIDDDDSLIEDELLIEEISIDGMCGVY
ncbi:MAG TPA: mycofactocin precursor MftA [Acidimicrobiales bacterium]|nr:mycofactocin precursor MftA [Acidimicrobiales bacterium]